MYQLLSPLTRSICDKIEIRKQTEVIPPLGLEKDSSLNKNAYDNLLQEIIRKFIRLLCVQKQLKILIDNNKHRKIKSIFIPFTIKTFYLFSVKIVYKNRVIYYILH